MTLLATVVTTDSLEPFIKRDGVAPILDRVGLLVLILFVH
jgi:hypothetical protein